MSSPDVPTGVRVTYRQQYRRCGKAGCAHCAPGHPGHGPYWYAFWRDGGQPRSRYLGKQAPALCAAPVAALRVQTLGGFAVWQGEAAIPPEAWTSHRAAALFKCLLGAPRHRLPREQASELLWPEAEPEAGATNLRTTIHRLRRVLDGPGAAVSYLRSEGELLVLAPAGDAEPVEEWLDATTFARMARAALAGQDAAACRAALALYGGEYLPDDPYEAWAAEPREALRRQYLDLLLHLPHLSGAQGELEEAETCLRQVLAAEPGHEAAAGTLMSLLATAGRRRDALRVYQTLATSLEELDLAPDAEIQALRVQLLAQDAAPVAAHFPPRQAQAARLTNLPVALTSLVGRAREVSEVRNLPRPGWSRSPARAAAARRGWRWR